MSARALGAAAGSQMVMLADFRVAGAARGAYEGMASVNNTAAVPPAGAPSPPPRRPGAETVLTLVNGVLAGVASVYIGTRSLAITILAVAMAVILAVLVLIFRR
jgi:heme/copper-type cytochrome/quinol oxidase subunit 3